MRFFRSLILFATAITFSSATAVADEPIEDHLTDATSLYHAGHWDDAYEAFEKVYGDSDEDSQIRAATALQWGSLLWERGDYARARQLVGESLDVARDLGMDDAIGELLSTLGHIEASTGDLAEAEHTLSLCVQLTEEMGDLVYRSLCRLNRRVVRTLRGKYPGSEEEYRSDVDTLAEADTALSVGTSLAKTAQLYRDNGDFERATELLDQAQEIYRQSGSVPAMRRNRLRIAQLLHRQGKYDTARVTVDGLAEQFEEMGNRPMLVHALAIEAEYALHQEDLEKAVQYYRRGLRIADEIDNPSLVGRIHVALCELNFSDSLDHCRKATETFDASKMTFLEIRARTALARSLQLRQHYGEARTAYRQAIAQLEDAVDTSAEPHAHSRTLQYANLCQVEVNLKATGSLSVCLEAVEGLDAFDEAKTEQFSELRAATIHSAGRAARREGRTSKAIEYFEEASKLYEELGQPGHLLLAADTLLHLGVIENSLDSRRDEAPDTLRRGLNISAELDSSDRAVATTHNSLMTQLSQRLLADGNWEEATPLLEELSESAREVGDLSTAAWAFSAVARAYLHSERRDDAIDALHSGKDLAIQAGDDELLATIEANLERLDN